MAEGPLPRRPLLPPERGHYCGCRRCASGSETRSCLASFFLRRFAAEYARPVRGFAPAALAAIKEHAWPGNVRELENRIKRAVVMTDGPLLSAADLGLSAPGEEPQSLDIRGGPRARRARGAAAGSCASRLKPVESSKAARDQPADALRSDAAAPDRPRCLTAICGRKGKAMPQGQAVGCGVAMRLPRRCWPCSPARPAYAKEFDGLDQGAPNSMWRREISRPPRSSCAMPSAKRLQDPASCSSARRRSISSSAMPRWRSARRAPPASATAMRWTICRSWQTPYCVRSKFADLLDLVQPGDREAGVRKQSPDGARHRRCRYARSGKVRSDVARRESPRPERRPAEEYSWHGLLAGTRTRQSRQADRRGDRRRPAARPKRSRSKGEMLRARGDLEGALRQFDEALKIDPEKRCWPS